MSINLRFQIIRGLDANRLSVTPLEGELLYTTDKKRLYIGDNSTGGGNWLSREEDQRFKEVHGVGIDELNTGFNLTELGARNIAISSGNLWDGLDRITTSPFDSSTISTFSTVYVDGLGGHTITTLQTQIDNSLYDNGSGTLIAIPALEYTNRWIYQKKNGDVFLVYGRESSLSLTAIEKENPPIDIPQDLNDNAEIIYKLTIRQAGASSTSSERLIGLDLSTLESESSTIDVEAAGVSITQNVKVIDFDSVSMAVVDDGAGKSLVSSTGAGPLSNLAIDYTKASNNVSSEYLNISHNIGSNETPFRALQNGKIRGITWQSKNVAGSNGNVIIRNNTVDALTIAVVSGELGNSTPNLNIDFVQGDLLSCYIENSSLTRPVVTIFISWES